MKLKQDFVLREIGGDSLLIPVSSLDSTFNGIISLNETSISIWKLLESGKEKSEIVDALLEEYDVEREQAEHDVDNFCAQLEQLGILEQ